MMKRVLRDNPLLAISIALPVVVVLLFAAAAAIPRLLSDPPAHDLLLTVEHGDTSRQLPVRIQLGVEGDSVVARVGKLGQYQQGYLPRVFRYDHQTRSVREVSIAVPANLEALEEGEAIPLPELEGLIVSTELRAPDGYEFRGVSSRGGLMMELFDASRKNRRVTIANNGAVVPIRLPESDYWYYGVHFLGWVVGEESKS